MLSIVKQSGRELERFELKQQAIKQRLIYGLIVVLFAAILYMS